MRRFAIHSPWAISFFYLCLLGAAPASAQDAGIDTDPAAEFDEEASVGGVEEELDSMDAQAEAAAANDGLVPGVSRHASTRIEEIVVSARKREEALEDTPVSVTALSENMLRDAGIQRLDQIQELVPNLQIRDGINGYDATVIIRGVGQGDTEITFDPGVGIYVDGVYLARSQGSVLSLVDTQQIEVLRGPQGTLFGKNTVGGAINLTTVKPSQEFGAFAFVRVGTLGTLDTRASLDLPIDIGWFEDKLFSRLTVASQNYRGYVYDEGNDVWANDHNAIGFLGSLRFLPSEDLTIDLSGSWFRDHNRARAARCVFVQNTTLTNAFVQPEEYREAYFESCRRSEPYRVDLDTAQLADIKSYGAWGTVTYELGELGDWIEDLQLKSISSWRGQQPRDRSDIDQTPFPIGRRATAGGDGTFDGGTSGPQPGLDGSPGNAWQVSEEVQATAMGWDGRAAAVVGVYGFWEKASAHRGEEYFPGPATRTAGGATTTTINVDNWSWALFGQTTIDPVEWLGLTFGLRYSEEKKGYSQLKAIPEFNGIAPPPLVGFQNPDTGELSPAVTSAKYSAWTPMASIAYRLPEVFLDGTDLDSLMAYFTFSRGYKSGGFNGGARSNDDKQLNPFEPESLDNFEVGSKIIALDQRLTLNASLFLGQYDDIQVRTIVPQACPEDLPDCVPPVDLVIENAASATTRGLELEFITMPFEGLRVQGSFALLDAKYNDFPEAASDLVDPTFDPDNSTVNRSGESFPGVPQMQTHLGVQYSFEINPGIESMRGWITPRFDWSYQSEVHFYGTELLEAYQPGYHLLHLRLSYDFMDDNAQFALWGKNITGTEYINHVTPVASTMGTVLQFYAPPASWGAELSYRF
jgi:iron complex outermembrane receptor protein